jgi:precorrin-3B synthase
MATCQHEVREREDACPGVLRLTEAADGGLARVRLPGGFLSAQGFSALADAAVDLGSGGIELTSRGNVQLRGLAADAGAELGVRLHAAGLWPSQTHERVRNIIASPLAGLDRDSDVSGIVGALDIALCATPRLADLSGRFLFAVDDGRGDVADIGADVVIRDGRVNGLRVPNEVAAALAVSSAFLDEREAQRSSAWRIADLLDGTTRVRSRTAGALRVDIDEATDGTEPRRSGPASAGLFKRLDGRAAVVLAVPLGRLNSEQLRWLAQVTGDEAARVTPWRSIVLPEAGATTLDAAARLGFGSTPNTAWSNVSACSGKPGCAHALADVQADARADLERWPGRVVHWSGCERRCGRSVRTEIDVVATEIGYRIEGI